MGKSKIEWVRNADGTKGETWNPISGCTKVSAGCRGCYAERMWPRLQHIKRYTGRIFTDVQCHQELLSQPLRWREPRKIFVCSQSDLFHEDVPDRFIAAVFGIMACCPQHVFQVLTKRPERMLKWYQSMRDQVPGYQMMRALSDHNVKQPKDISVAAMNYWPPSNIWLGVSIEDRPTANERVPQLLQCPATVRWLSVEPLLKPIDFSPWLIDNPLDVTDTNRRDSLSGRPQGLDRSARGRIGMEDCSAAKESLGRSGDDKISPPTSDRRLSGKRLSGSQNHDRQQTNNDTSAQTGVAVSQRADPIRSDDQSHKRDKERQSSRQSRARDTFRANTSHDRRSRQRQSTEPARRTECNDEIDNPASSGNKTATSGRRETDFDSKGLRSDVPNHFQDRSGRTTISWVVCGGESGPKARPMHPDWVRSIRDQCVAAGVPFFFKQWGEWLPSGQDDAAGNTQSTDADYARAGKKKAGNLLDGKVWEQYPNE